MFDNIGKKIMRYVKIVCVIGIICTMMMMALDIVAITSMSYSQKVALYGSSDNTVAILSSVFSHLLIAAGIYVGTWVLYAFGQMVDDVHAMRMKDVPVNLAVKNDVPVDLTAKNKQTAVIEPVPTWKCTECGQMNFVSYGTCKKCGAQKPRQQTKKWICMSCGSSNTLNVLFCTKCGKKKPKEK